MIIPAGIAFTAFGVAAIPALQRHLHPDAGRLHHVGRARHEHYPLTGGFAAMAQAVQPEVYQLFGQALVVMQHNTGTLTAVGCRPATSWTPSAPGAVALTSGGFGTFLKEGPADLAKIGDIANIFGTVGTSCGSCPATRRCSSAPSTA